MTKLFRFISNKFLNKRLDFRVRLFNVLAMGGTVISVLMMLMGIALGTGTANVLTNAVIAILSFSLLCYSYKSGKYQLCYAVTITVIFLLLFPVLYITSGGYHSGMPSFFVFAILFTIFMLEGKTSVFFTVLELSVYGGLFVFAYLFPEYINFYSTELDLMLDIMIAFLVVSITLGITMFLHFRLYNEQQRELEAARRKLSEENAALEHLNRLKTEFLGNISHELKTPLTVVSGYAQTSQIQLADHPESEVAQAVQNKMKLISSEAERLALMVGQILDVTRIEEGRMSIELFPCRIDEIIQSAVDTHFPILNKNNNRLKLHIASGLPKINADAPRITQVIVNLVANAIRFTANGEITISANQKGSYIAVTVEDTGRGIAPERINTIFERFNQNKSPGEATDTGTGLGLYICKHIIEGHSGEISVESKLDKGSSFLFTVPIALS